LRPLTPTLSPERGERVENAELEKEGNGKESFHARPLEEGLPNVRQDYSLSKRIWKSLASVALI
jgi:hypothetical protein